MAKALIQVSLIGEDKEPARFSVPVAAAWHALTVMVKEIAEAEQDDSNAPASSTSPSPSLRRNDYVV